MSLSHVNDDVYSIQHYVTCDRSVVFSGYSVSSTIKPDRHRHDITQVLLKMVLSTIDQTKYNTVGTAPKSNNKLVIIGKIDTTNPQIYGYSLFWLLTGSSMKGVGVKLVLWIQTSPLK